MTDNSSEADGQQWGRIVNQYPWLLQFQMDLRTTMEKTKVTAVDVCRMVTFLERNVSPEVSLLKSMPNRATRFLGEVKRCVVMVKMSGHLIESEMELRLFPTYGLLMTHFVNITFSSSQQTKLGAQQMAQDLYHFLKLVFQGSNGFILDVVLCSIIDEHAFSKHAFGFQLLACIVQDWEYFSGSYPTLLKYYAISALLSTTCPCGESFVASALPPTVDKKFLNFLVDTLNIQFAGGSDTSIVTPALVSGAIKVPQVKSMSREGLFIVSTRTLSPATMVDDIKRETLVKTPPIPRRSRLETSSSSTGNAAGVDTRPNLKRKCAHAEPGSSSNLESSILDDLHQMQRKEKIYFSNYGILTKSLDLESSSVEDWPLVSSDEEADTGNTDPLVDFGATDDSDSD